ncbi:MAG: hypothetical protein M3O55_04485 [Actinomycetota bacterium]|nr:hypothetical protein [Actinomycetota bacterium]
MTTDLPALNTLIAVVKKEFAFSEADRVGAAVTVAAELGSLGDQLVTHFVSVAREAGCSWSQIGEQLGVSKQAAQQGFVAPAKQGRFGRRRIIRMDQIARASVAVAQDEARALRHRFIGTEHLLLGLLGQPTGAAARVLSQSGIKAEAVRKSLEEIVGPGTGEPLRGHLPLAARAKKVLQLALREATAANAPAIGTEHILLGILREGEGMGCQILVKLGIDLGRLRQAITDERC